VGAIENGCLSNLMVLIVNKLSKLMIAATITVNKV
jgi:hypothetical protein